MTRYSGFAVASFLFALAAPFTLVTALPALVFGLVGLRRINRSEGQLAGRPLAVAGLVIGGLVTAFAVVGAVCIGVLELRALSARVGCGNNLRQIGEGVKAYADAHGDHFPPGVLPSPRPVDERLSWYVGIAPLMNKGKGPDARASAFAGDVDRAAPWDAPGNAGALTLVYATFRCPAGAGFTRAQRPGLTNYIGLTGIDAASPYVPADDPRAGFFGYDRVITAAACEAGTGYTLAALETAENLGPWARGGPATTRWLAGDDAAPLGPGRAFGGLHPGGTNALMADGSVRFLADSMSPATLRLLARLSRPDDAPDDVPPP